MPFASQRFLSGSGSGSSPEASKPEGADAQPEGETEKSAGSGSAEKESEGKPSGPRVLFTAPPVTKLAGDAEGALKTGSILSAGGLAAGLLGVAPFTPPNPFMIGLLLSVLQVQFAHGWMLRQLWAQQRRHVLEIVEEQEGENGPTLITIKCDGGLTRKLRLTPRDSSPSFADIVKEGRSFIFLDRKSGEAVDLEALEALLQSERGIQSEEVIMEPVSGESPEEAGKLVQKFKDLTSEHLTKIADKCADSPKSALEGLIRNAQLTGAGILFFGSALGISGRMAADKPPTESPQGGTKSK